MHTLATEYDLTRVILTRSESVRCLPRPRQRNEHIATVAAGRKETKGANTVHELMASQDTDEVRSSQ